jgi:hypothetical protein
MEEIQAISGIGDLYSRINDRNNRMTWIENPNFQRYLDMEHVNDIVINIKKYYNKYNKQPSIGSIVVCRQINNKYTVVDGQHRLAAVRHMDNEGYIIKFHLAIIDADSDDEVFEQYLICNNNKNHADWVPDEVNADKHICLNQIADWLRLFNNQHSEIFVDKDRCSRPKISINRFLDDFVNSDYYDQCYTLEDFKAIFNTVNDKHYNNYGR